MTQSVVQVEFNKGICVLCDKQEQKGSIQKKVAAPNKMKKMFIIISCAAEMKTSQRKENFNIVWVLKIGEKNKYFVWKNEWVCRWECDVRYKTDIRLCLLSVQCRAYIYVYELRFFAHLLDSEAAKWMEIRLYNGNEFWAIVCCYKFYLNNKKMLPFFLLSFTFLFMLLLFLLLLVLLFSLSFAI